MAGPISFVLCALARAARRYADRVVALPPGSTFASYRIESLLGRGGMGVVYLAADPRLGRKVALKVIGGAIAEAPSTRERFLAESRLAAALDHPHILPVYEAGEFDGQPYLAMRYVPGFDLGHLLAGGRGLPSRALFRLAGRRQGRRSSGPIRPARLAIMAASRRLAAPTFVRMLET